MRVNKEFYISPLALDRYKPVKVEGQSVRITGEIGWDVTLNKVLDQLADKTDVDVVINSPGGDMFEGLAIYEALRDHPGKVRVKVLGLAASAASLIAMAGDEIEVAESGYLMIHNAWVVAVGNKNQLRDVSIKLEEFDTTLSKIYSKRTGIEVADVSKLMDAETWINGEEAVKMGFADKAAQLETEPDETSENARAEIDLILAKSGVSRSERRRLLASYRSTQNAVPEDTQNAVKDLSDALENFKTLFKS